MEDSDFAFVLEAFGYNTECTDINMHYELLLNIKRDTFRKKTHKNVEGVGSIFEGVDSISYFGDFPDVDFVRNYTECEVNPSKRPLMDCDIVNVENDLKIMRCSNFPGYVCITLGKYWLSNTILHASNHKTDLLTQDYLKKENNGPACSEYLMHKGAILIKMDVVNCYAYKSWPVEANKWVSRNKPNNWPSKELIEKIKSKGFNLAPVGHYDCNEFHKEFQHRIGIRGERELLMNLNETQLLCYVALRLILKADIQKVDKDVLSSFHMKNVVFWCAEQESCQWTKDNVKICLKTCINKLTEFITCGKFPHYFIEDRNLVNSKMTPYLKRTIVNALTKYSSDVLAILNLSVFDHLKKKTNNFKTTLLEREKQISVIHRCILFYWETLNDFYSEPHTLWQTYESHNTMINLQNAKDILTCLEKTKRNFILKHTLYVKSMLGLLYYSRYHETRCKSNELKLNAVKLLSSVTFKNVSLEFRVANFYFMENEFEKCLDFCNYFLRKPRKYKTGQEKLEHSHILLQNIIIYIDELNVITELKEKMCAFFYHECISDKCGDCRLQQVDIQKKTPKLIMQYLPNLLLCDMSLNVPYLASEKWALPHVFQYELLSVQKCHPESFIFGIYIDPMLNCLVLSFLCYNETNNLTQRDEMLVKMAEYIKQYSNNGQPVSAELPHSLPLYRVYNIVAYCFIKAGRYQLALKYILNSYDLNKNADNTASGYIRCVRLYVKEHIKLISLAPHDV